MKIITNRLTLRPFLDSDFDAVYPLLSSKEVMRFSLNGPYSKKKTSDFISHCITQSEKKSPSLLAVIENTTGRLIGCCGFYQQKINGISEVELGYRLLKAYWGKGLASEAAIAMKKHAFAEMGLTRLISIIERENIASIRVAQKVGLTLEKTMRYDQRIDVGIYATNHT